MKKKILFIILCLLSLTYMNGVSARECTQNDIDSARATLKVSKAFENIPIYSLGRGSEEEAGRRTHVNLYTMTLTHNTTGVANNAFCMNGEKGAHSNLVYKIDKYVGNDINYRRIYQYAMENINNPEKYISAQIALWTYEQKGELTWAYLYMPITELVINKDCKGFLTGAGMDANQANQICSESLSYDNAAQHVRSKLTSWYQINGISYNGQTEYITNFENRIKNEINNFLNFTVTYSGNLYRWVEVNGGNYQPMLSPLICDENQLSCTDQNGNVHDYTNEYNDCLTKGGEPVACRTNLENTYCSNNSSGVIKFQEEYAACNNNFVNYGYFNEVVDTTVSGNAIPGKGEPEKLVTQYCNLFCLENKAQQIFPGNVKPAVSVGTYIIWPTSEATLSSKYKNQYPLKFSGEKTCYVVMAGEDNTVNKNDVNEVLNGLLGTANRLNKAGKFSSSGRLGSGYSGNNYEYIRTRMNGCETAYSTSTGYCKEEQNNYNDKLAVYNNKQANYNNINNQNNSKISNLRGQLDAAGADKTKYDKCISEKERACQKMNSLNNCSESNFNSSNECREAVQTCKFKSCGSEPNLGPLRKQINELQQEIDDAKDEMDDAKTALDNASSILSSCKNEKDACKNYEASVQKIIDFSNEIKLCATYNGGSCSGSSCEMYNFATNVDLSWGDSEYGTVIHDSDLEKKINYNLQIDNNVQPQANVNYSQSINQINSNALDLINEVSEIVKKRKIVANVNVTYSLPTSGNLLYNYVVKRNNRFVSQTARPSSDSNYVTIGYSNLPISFDAKTNQDYHLILSNIRFGDNGGQYKQDMYTCNYKVTKTPDSDCLCPVGTKHEGKDLSSFIIDKGLTCYDAQKAFCDYEPQTCPDGSKQSEMTSCLTNEYPGDYFTCYDKYCRSGNKDKYCPNKPEIKLTTCLNNYSYDYCYNLLCTSNVGSEYKCENTNGVDGEMDITSCVYTKIAQGLSLNDAINECDALICPLSGLRIIYRTISLENPFPGKNISNMVNGFNDDVKGRYPGANWNDVKLVNKHILTVKRQGITYDGSAIYQGEPLYTFVLTTSTINAIRNYNEQQILNGGYADYTLDCKLNNSRACVSSFVHNPDLSGLVSGTCMSSTSRSNFYLCSGDN